MNKYYIVSNQGLLKLYYSESAATSGNGNFSSSVRNAKPFETIDDAKKMISEKELKECYIINQIGVVQK